MPGGTENPAGSSPSRTGSGRPGGVGAAETLLACATVGDARARQALFLSV